MEQYGNATTFNVENVLRQNILSSEYYNKTCGELISWEDVVDEIYENVDHVEPWMSGNARGPSTAFCLLYRLFEMKLNVKQVKDLLDHKDSPYIRAVGFLYLRYVADPKTLWGWVQRYIQDGEVFSPSGSQGKSITVGEFLRDILLEQYYFETIFPRIPKKVSDDIIAELSNRGLPAKAKGNAGQGGADRRGVEDGNRRPASVKASLSVAMGQRAPNRAGAREEGRGKDPSMGRNAIIDNVRGGGGRDLSRRGSRSPPAGYGRKRSRSPPVGYGRKASRSPPSYSRRDSEDRDSGRDCSRDDGRGREDRDRYRNDRGGRQERSRDERDRYRDERGSRDERGREDKGHREHRPRSRSRGPKEKEERGRDTRDVFRDRAVG
ncbi:hypothetical protein CEUSTIGMA_g10921.t1 [Chlamydomonas eustigma]|uniref:Pre-mRNA-splicing factor 38 n=1 Tax=Chlamydomonas eustigma TaxID=1157962 RepID=A0A250XKE9_9CHLO|nr:hypothetical protein CEUSTIGMA_g10921.t1 [Chlamydomonas eustigma]|eukprot:GAX83496.1 hypothetical protein CEUSTIGMA_g10921.t1 [Chlamydomonas eustigma]